MAKFIYSMQSLLNIKQKLEDQEKTAFGLAKATLNEEEEKLRRLFLQKQQYTERKRMEMSGRINARELNMLEQAIKSTDDRIAEQRVVVKRAEQAVAMAQKRLENAMKERKIQETLREHAFEEFKKEVEAEEQKEINELVTFRFGNAKSEE